MDLVEQLIKIGHLKSPQLISAFRKIKRRDFVLSSGQSRAESDSPQEIGFGQTISQPSTVVFMLELCQPKVGEKILDIGSGSGWTTALLAEAVGPVGKVYAIERIAELKDFGEQNAEKYNFVSSGRATFVCTDGSKGLPEFAPYDIIHVGAAASRVPPALLEQLNVGGRLIIPVGTTDHNLVLVTKTGPQSFQEKRIPGFIFVPLIET